MFTPLTRYSLATLVGVSLFLPMTAIAKPNKPVVPKPTQTPTETIETLTPTASPVEAVQEVTLWSDLLSDLNEQYEDLPSNLMEHLKGDEQFRTVLFDLFGAETTGLEEIQEILLDILQSQDVTEDGFNGGEVEAFHYTYVVDRECLPPGQRQRLDSGKLVPPGILKKCGQIETVAVDE